MTPWCGHREVECFKTAEVILIGIHILRPTPQPSSSPALQVNRHPGANSGAGFAAGAAPGEEVKGYFLDWWEISMEEGLQQGLWSVQNLGCRWQGILIRKPFGLFYFHILVA